ncbi:MAG: bacteriocin, partial [Comamonadaceae bacterium CG12_big_fil_rev_8_21_14_0_65_59_15]
LKIVNQYNLRWDAPDETAYPSTFVFDKQGTVRFVKISQSHADRSSAAVILTMLQSMK